MVSEMGGAAKDIIKNEGNVKGLWTLANRWAGIGAVV